jgi:hypothetical protein
MNYKENYFLVSIIWIELGLNKSYFSFIKTLDLVLIKNKHFNQFEKEGRHQYQYLQRKLWNYLFILFKDNSKNNNKNSLHIYEKNWK